MKWAATGTFSILLLTEPWGGHKGGCSPHQHSCCMIEATKGSLKKPFCQRSRFWKALLLQTNNQIVRMLCLKSRSEGKVKEYQCDRIWKTSFELRNIVSFWDPEGADTEEVEIFLLPIMQALGIMVISSSTAEIWSLLAVARAYCLTT